MLEDLDIVYDSTGRSRRRRLKKKGHDKPDPTVIPPAYLLTAQVTDDLAAGLDASDVLECYWLTRRVFLQGVANETISVSKTALGLRYRPPPWATESNPHKREIVLEYGPDRTGSKSENDVLPVIIPAATPASPAYVAWQNEGKVFYSQEIHALQYESATYMASVTGAVVADALQVAARYPANRGSKRYQPWQVMLVNDAKKGASQEETAVVKLRSSSDVDFVMYLLQHLANLGVDLLPVLRPTVYSLELVVKSVSRQTFTPTSKQDMANFYQRLYGCLNQLADGQPASRMTPPAITTIAPTPAEVTVSTLKPSAAAQLNATAAPSYSLDFRGTLSPTASTPPRRSLQHHNNKTDANDTATATTIPTTSPTVSATITATDTPTPTVAPSTMIPTSVPTHVKTFMPSQIVPPTPPDPAPSTAAADAQKAAEAAHAAAKNATDVETATQAAQQAVDAAQQAVDVTIVQEAKLRQEALLSGNGQEMALTASLCFSDPIYGIRKEHANQSTAYLYWDASYYFSLELVHPYVRVVPETWTPPTPDSNGIPAFARGGTAVDLSLGVIFVVTLVLGFLLLMQRISPSSSWRSQWFYKYQRWFFDPMHHNFDEEENEELKRRSESRPLGRDGIPLSMGGTVTTSQNPLYVGRRRGASKDGLYRSQSSSAHGKDDSLGGGGGGDLEMVAQKSVDLEEAAFSDDEFIDDASAVSSRLFRDPEMVELPDLSSSSKVAIPVSLQLSSNDNFD